LYISSFYLSGSYTDCRKFLPSIVNGSSYSILSNESRRTSTKPQLAELYNLKVRRSLARMSMSTSNASKVYTDSLSMRKKMTVSK
jgi:IS1 family transposase